MLELRTYTLSSDEVLERYASIHWKRHISSLAAFGITTRHIWKQVRTDKPQLVVLMQYADGVDPEELIERYMGSAEFHADMEGFSMADIFESSSVFVEPASSDPQ